MFFFLKFIFINLFYLKIIGILTIVKYGIATVVLDWLSKNISMFLLS